MKTQSFEKANSEKVLSTISLSERFYFFLPSTNSRIVIYLPNKRSTVSNACLRTIDISHFLLSIYIYMYTYRRQSILECRNQQTVRNKIRNMQWLIIIPLNKITIRTQQLAGFGMRIKQSQLALRTRRHSSLTVNRSFVARGIVSSFYRNFITNVLTFDVS